MKRVVIVLAMLVLPSLLLAQSKGDMLPFQGPNGAFAGMFKSSTKTTIQNQENGWGYLSEEGITLKQVIDQFIERVKYSSVVEELNKGYLTKAYKAYLLIQSNKVELLEQMIPLYSQPDMRTKISLQIEVKRKESKIRDMIEEKKDLLNYLNKKVNFKRSINNYAGEQINFWKDVMGEI